jgi:hypothetical protein
MNFFEDLKASLRQKWLGYYRLNLTNSPDAIIEVLGLNIEPRNTPKEALPLG